MSSNVNKVPFGGLPAEVLNLIGEKCYEQEGLNSPLRGVSPATRHWLLDVHARKNFISVRHPAGIVAHTARRKRKHFEAAQKYLKEGRLDLERASPLLACYQRAFQLTSVGLLAGGLLIWLGVTAFCKQVEENGVLSGGAVALVFLVYPSLLGLVISSLAVWGCVDSLRYRHDRMMRLRQLETQVSDQIAVLDRREVLECDLDVD